MKMINKIDASLLPHQKEFLRSKKAETLLVGGWGSGKTYASCINCLKKLFENPTKIVLMIQPLYRDVVDACFPTFKKQLGSIGMVDGKDYFLMKLSKELIFKHIEGKILFRSLDRIESIDSINPIHVHLDDLHRINKNEALKAIDRCLDRLKRTEGATLSVSTTSYPGYEKVGEYYEYFIKNRDPERQHIVYANTEQNPYLPNSYIENLKKIESNE